MSDDTAGIITLLLDEGLPSDPLSDDAGGFGWGCAFVMASMRWGEGLEVAKMAGGIHIFQSETRTPELRAQGVLLCVEGVNLPLDALNEGVSVVISLEISMEPPVLQSKCLFDHQGVGVRVGLDLSNEPGGHGVRDVMGVDVRDGVEVLNEDIVILPPGSTHDSTLVNVFDIAGLDGIPVDGDGKMGDTSIVLFEAFRTLGFGGSLIVSNAALEIMDGSSGSRFNACGTEVPKGFSLSNGCIESFLPDDIGFGVSCVDSLLDCVGLASEGFNEYGFMGDSSGLGVQLGNGGTSDGFGQGVSSLRCESTSGVIEDIESSLWFDKRFANHLEDRG
jgi:hypothetical protein